MDDLNRLSANLLSFFVGDFPVVVGDVKAREFADIQHCSDKNER